MRWHRSTRYKSPTIINIKDDIKKQCRWQVRLPTIMRTHRVQHEGCLCDADNWLPRPLIQWMRHKICHSTFAYTHTDTPRAPSTRHGLRIPDSFHACSIYKNRETFTFHSQISFVKAEDANKNHCPGSGIRLIYRILLNRLLFPVLFFAFRQCRGDGRLAGREERPWKFLE